MKGTIELFDVVNDVWTFRTSIHNNILNSGYDAMAKAFAGDSTHVVNGMYVEYTNNSPIEPVIPLDRTPAYYRALASPFGYTRFKTTSQPVFTTSDASKYTSNVITLMGVTDGTSAGGAPIIDGTSRFISLALVSIPSIEDETDSSGDCLVSAASLSNGSSFTPITKLANSQLGFQWSLKLGD